MLRAARPLTTAIVLLLAGCAESDGVMLLDAGRRPGARDGAMPGLDAPSCRDTGGACAVTSDCCDPLVCVANQCVVAPGCAGVDGPCYTDLDCCAGLACVFGGCAEPPAPCFAPGPGSCPVGQYCDFDDDECGRGFEGLCRPTPDACADVFAPACACDGTTYPNACEAWRAGWDVERGPACTFDGGVPPP